MNSEGDEWAPVLSPDGATLVFATDERSRPTPYSCGSGAIQRGLVTPGRLLRVSAVLAAVVVVLFAAGMVG